MRKMAAFALLPLSILLFSACKKGENDPFLSLRSRKARVAGEWTVTKISSTQTNVSNGTTDVMVISYDGQSYHETVTSTTGGVSQTSSSTSTVSLKLTLEKDGTYTETYVENGDTQVIKGTWIFLAKSKENDLKNKEAILLTETSHESNSGSNVQTGLDGQTFVIDQLKNKEMVWTSTSSYTSNDGSSGSSESSWTLEQK